MSKLKLSAWTVRESAALRNKMKLDDIWDLFPCPSCGNDYAYYVTIKMPQGEERYGKVWNTGLIEDPERALYLGDEWNELAESEVLYVSCTCGKTIYPRNSSLDYKSARACSPRK